MSFIVKGMEMPKRCFECPIIDATDGFWCSATDKDLRKEHGINLSKPDWCPLSPLSKRHGRLIDADAFKETLEYYILEAGWDEKTNQVLGWVKDEFIDSERTIVEAEGE